MAGGTAKPRNSKTDLQCQLKQKGEKEKERREEVSKKMFRQGEKEEWERGQRDYFAGSPWGEGG